MRNLLIPAGLFILVVFSSKQLFIYNEELIVAFSFIGFVLFTQSAFGDTIKAAFDERQNSILTELQQYCVEKEALLLEFMKQHELRSVSLRSSAQMLGEATIQSMYRCAPMCKHTVLSVLSQQYDQKLKTLLSIQDLSHSIVSARIVTNFRKTVCGQFRFEKLRLNQSRLVKQSIKLLKAGLIRL